MGFGKNGQKTSRWAVAALIVFAVFVGGVAAYALSTVPSGPGIGVGFNVPVSNKK